MRTHNQTAEIDWRILDRQLHLWYVHYEDACKDHLLSGYETLLSPRERERWQRFVFQRHGDRFLASRALLRTVLSLYAPAGPEQWRFTTNAFGKPEISGPPGQPPLCFNLSHCSHTAACIVGLRPVIGIDVESPRGDVDCLSIAEGYFSKTELNELMACPSDEERRRLFLTIWTLKEAYLKALGTGLGQPLDTFYFSQVQDPRPRIHFIEEASDDSREWQFYRLDLQSTLMAVAWQRGQGDPCKILVREKIPQA